MRSYGICEETTRHARDVARAAREGAENMRARAEQIVTHSKSLVARTQRILDQSKSLVARTEIVKPLVRVR
jgi:ElaB/YqjD/DUF883 family membrane-anchored ribosome-binding protein